MRYSIKLTYRQAGILVQEVTALHTAIYVCKMLLLAGTHSNRIEQIVNKTNTAMCKVNKDSS